MNEIILPSTGLLTLSDFAPAEVKFEDVLRDVVASQPTVERDREISKRAKPAVL